MPELCRHKVDISYVRAGLVSKAALFRVLNWTTIEQFLGSKKPSTTCTLSIHNREYSYKPKYGRYGQEIDSFRLSIGVDVEIDYKPIVDRLIFPLPTPLTIGGNGPPTDAELNALATVDWEIYLLAGPEGGRAKIKQIQPNDPIDTTLLDGRERERSS